jgi:hypothetical protein
MQYAMGEKMEEKKMKKGGEAKKAPVYGRAMMRVTADTKGRALGKGK